ncbi:MAG: tetratricopeptide repeat protein [Rubripirellula sp.]
MFLICCCQPVRGSDLDDAQTLLKTGKYQEAETFAAEQVEAGIWNERWPRLLIQCQMTLGKYEAATKIYEDAIKRYPTSLTLRMQGLEAYRLANQPDRAADSKNQIMLLLHSSPLRYASRDNLVAAGRYFSMLGEDARKILEAFYDRVRDADPEHLEAYIATAELALDKGDFQVAAETLSAAQRFNESDPRVPYLQARAWESSDSEKATAGIESALKLNPNHLPSLLYQAEAAIDRERYGVAEALLKKVQQINPHEQDSWALLAVIAHLRGSYENEKLLRTAALSTWAENPRVDHLIGLKLSQKYRFEEGAAYQRKALDIDPSYSPARFQLAQDLLRLGHEDVGWEVARLVAEDDQYNVVAHNLMTLQDRIKGFTVLEADGIQVRMESQEAAIYGEAVLDLLSEAKRVLCSKYDSKPRAPIVVEIFPEQKDFAIRTFGLPGGAGFLGVCFGRVITANSPASQGEQPANWRSVLWHEFCHVVTLEKTKNRMPRWLSEGISVYEERQRDPSWGESMTPIYREMLLDEELTPVTELSGAFLSPPSAIHLQFAYYESSLVVEFMIERHGIDAIKGILEDLGSGLNINDAMARHVGSLQKLDSQFAEYARKRAESFGSEADWSREEMPEKGTAEQWASWVEDKPNSYWGLRKLSEARVAAKQFEEAKESLEKIQTLEAMTGERGDPLELLALVYRNLKDLEAEQKTLETKVSLSSDALPALRRLIEMSKEGEDWDAINSYAQKVIAINPLLPEGHDAIADSAEQREQPADAIPSLRALSRMDPVDPAAVDFRLAAALCDVGDLERSKHHVMRALVEAPRYRDAHRLLLKLKEAAAAETKPADTKSADEKPADETPETKSSETNAERESAERETADATPPASVAGSEPGSEPDPLEPNPTSADDLDEDEAPAE